MFKGLSLDQAPPFKAPLLFYATGLVFGIIGSFATFFLFLDFIPLFHLFTIGFFLSVMFGSLEQMLPVVIGAKFKHPFILSVITLLFLIVGLLFFFKSLVTGATILSIGVLGFALLTLFKLFTSPFFSPTKLAIIFSLLSLVAGVVSILSYLLLGIPFANIYHFTLMLWGWVGLLIMGVSFQVIPMFYVTFEIKKSYQYFLVIGVFVSLLLSFFFPIKLYPIFFLIYAGVVIFQLLKRKRKIKEPSILFWYCGLTFLILSSIFLLLDVNWLKVVVIFLFGFAMSIIFGMLYKIIPFLSWFHTSSKGFFDIPTMKEMVEERLAYLQLAIYLLALFSLFFKVELSASFFLLSFLLLGFNLLKPVKIYFKYLK